MFKSETKKSFVEACVVCSVKRVPPLLEIIDSLPQVGNTFSNGLFATVRTSVLQQVKVSIHPEDICTLARAC